tara:strand:- start:1717 stop:1917 length:201 start_codon:yes stop_codon:yes gene_type:complete
MSHPVNDMIKDEAVEIFDSMSFDEQMEKMKGWSYDPFNSMSGKDQRECFAVNKIFEELMERPGPHG